MWGDGKQTRSFTFIDDCVEGVLRITKSEFREPLNLGSCEMVSMNDMMGMVAKIEGKVRARGAISGQPRGPPLRAVGALLVLPRVGAGCRRCSGLAGARPAVGGRGPTRRPRPILIAFLSPPHTQDLPIKHIPGPEGVRGRNSDNELILEKLGWQPTICLEDGLRLTYKWIQGQIAKETERGVDAAAYSQSMIVKTSAPTELGTLRKADGDEGFGAK